MSVKSIFILKIYYTISGTEIGGLCRLLHDLILNIPSQEEIQGHDISRMWGQEIGPLPDLMLLDLVL
jgi:hypothetical protein